MSHRFGFWLLHACIVGLMIPLVGAFYIQFAEGELPCPLCILQRMGMLMAALGPAYILLRLRKGQAQHGDMAVGFGISILAALLGLMVSTRQILLHIVPPDPGFGDPVMGLHLYSWGAVVFLVVLATSGLCLVFSHALLPSRDRFNPVSAIVLSILAALILGNVVAVFFEEGFHWVLPDDPTRYQLFEDLGLSDAVDSPGDAGY